MEILAKVITFSSGACLLMLAAKILTAYLYRHHPQIVRKILGEN